MNKTNQMAAIAVSKSLLKEYQTSQSNRTVYLDGDNEFQIRLFNPTSDVVGAEVFINDESLGSKIVLRPGEQVWLERYLNEARKFKFDVYSVDANNKNVMSAIKNNGEIKIQFYRERKRETFITLSWPYNNDNINHYYNSIDGSSIYGNMKTLSCSEINTSLTRGLCDYDVSTTFQANDTIETGRVTKGGHSTQDFSTIDIDFEYFPFDTETIKILPKSQKPFTKNDLEKIYCVECGRKIKPRFKYCPYCGSKQ